MDHKSVPDGFSIWHEKVRKWCWRQTSNTGSAKELGYDTERKGFRTRPAALSDLQAELGRRKQLADEVQKTTGICGANG